MLHFVALMLAGHASYAQEAVNVKMPQLNDEERMSSGMPRQFRCHACAAVAWQLGAGCQWVP